MKVPSVSDAVSVHVPVATIAADAPLKDALQTMHSEGIHHLVVREGDAIIGMVSDRDIYGRGTSRLGLSLDPRLSVGDVMTRLERFATETTSLRDALELFATSGVSALPVIGPLGLTGIITETDLLRALRLLLAEPAPGTPENAGGTLVLSNPLIQEAMCLLSQAGI